MVALTGPTYLTAEQEQQLALHPEHLHSRIANILSTPHFDDTTFGAPRITTVSDAVRYLHASDLKASQASIDPATLVQLPSEPVPAEPEPAPAPAPKPKREPVVSDGSYARYVAACQDRKLKLKQLKSRRMDLKLALPSIAASAAANRTQFAAFEAWALQQRQACETYIASHAPTGYTVPMQATLDELAQLDKDIEALTYAVPKREDFKS